MRNDCIDSETVKIGRREYTIKVYPDEGTESPLENDEGVFITCDKGARSQYGNTPVDEDEHLRIARRIEEFGNPPSAIELANALREDPEEEPLGEPLIGLSVYVYEHSGVAISTRPWTGRAHHAEWDSGQSGFIYITKKTALDWQGGKRLTKAKLERVYKSLESVVEEYSKWCNGETYFYIVEDEDGNDTAIGCGGYIGTEYMMASAKDEIAAFHKWRVTEACKRRIAAAKERIERLFWAARDVVTA